MDEQDNSVPLKSTSFSSERKNIVLQWALKLNNALARAETWHLEHHTLKVKNVYYWPLYLL